MVSYCAHILIKGIVQGVFFRDFVKENALALDIKGFVRNLDDGSVEVFAEGSREILEKFIGLLKIGPEKAAVDSINSKFRPCSNEFSQFIIQY